MKPEVYANNNDKSYTYKVRIEENEIVLEVPICYEEFCSMHGISGKRLHNIQKALKDTGKAHTDKKNNYDHKHCRTPEDVKQNVLEHIQFFKDRSCHYSLSKTKKLYLSETLNISKMYMM